MGIKLDVSVETPLSDDDRDILAGISVMVLAIANRQNLAEQEQQRQDYEDMTEGVEPLTCGAQRDDGQVCMREPGHSGRHRYRPLTLSFTGNGLEN
jgi:hypothetical protein